MNFGHHIFQGMDLAFASPFYPANGRKPILDIKPLSSSTLNRKLSSQKTSPCMATVATQTSQVSLPIPIPIPSIIYFFPLYFKPLLLHNKCLSSRHMTLC
jgi:hypothetical protein